VATFAMLVVAVISMIYLALWRFPSQADGSGGLRPSAMIAVALGNNALRWPVRVV
jgi:hypothetical protein